MQYLIAFIEGIITIVSPCILPLLPLYLAYFAGNDTQIGNKKVITNVIGFIIGFTIVFVALGILAGTIGSYLAAYRSYVNIVLGIIVIFFGLSFLGIIKFTPGRKTQSNVNVKNLGFFSSLIFGLVFAFGWTPCITAFLGSALLLASQQASMIHGGLLLLVYSMGLGVPLLIAALLMHKLRTGLSFIKKHYDIINKISGAILIALGLLMAFGLLI